MIGQSYIVAAYIDGYASQYQLPEAYSTNRSYGYFPPPPDDRDTALFIGRDPDDLRPYFADVREIGDVGDDMHAYLLTGRQQSWEPDLVAVAHADGLLNRACGGAGFGRTGSSFHQRTKESSMGQCLT